ncbi:MAG: hypothetical protein ABQ298_01630 [Puniceicoccaceae bacterium]
MKTFKNVLALSVLLFAFVMNAQVLERSESLADGTVIPAGAEMIIGEDGTVQYVDEGIILASVKTFVSSAGTTTEITKRLRDGSYVLVVIAPNGTVSNPVPTSAPTPVTPGTGGSVGGSGAVQGPSGASIPNNPATVI